MKLIVYYLRKYEQIHLIVTISSKMKILEWLFATTDD